MSPLQQESTALARILRAQPGFDQLPDADFAELSEQWRCSITHLAYAYQAMVPTMAGSSRATAPAHRGGVGLHAGRGCEAIAGVKVNHVLH